MTKGILKKSEQSFERVLYAMRWLLAPIYLGLSLVLVIIGFKFFQEIHHVMFISSTTRESKLILEVLGLIDLTLVGGLVIMIMLSGYENFGY